MRQTKSSVENGEFKSCVKKPCLLPTCKDFWQALMYPTWHLTYHGCVCEIKQLTQKMN